MNNEEISIKFIYNNEEKGSLSCKPGENLKEIFQKFASEHGIDFNKILFEYNGQRLIKEDYAKTIAQYFGPSKSDFLLTIKDNPNYTPEVPDNINPVQVQTVGPLKEEEKVNTVI